MTTAAETTEVDLAGYLEKPATPLQARFADYLTDEVGYNPNAAKTKLEAFQEGVRLATALRMVFQASDFNRNARAALKAEQAQEAPAPPPVKATKATKAAKATPAKSAPAKAAKATPAKSAPATRRRAAQPAAEPDNAPF